MASRALKILLTNQALEVRAGTEPMIRDLARGLQARGHMVIAYTSDPCQRERLLERDLIAVATTLENLPVVPDIIHAHHQLDAFTALTALPGVPAIYHEHGGFWQDSPPRHPRIHHYLAPSADLARVMGSCPGMAAADVSVFPLVVDGTRFQKVRCTAAVPTRALLINRHFAEDGEMLRRIKEAAGANGLALDIVGREFGCGSEEAEEILPAYDVVFASGQSAAEALACGCAVMLIGPGGIGELVDPANFGRLYATGFAPPDSAAADPMDHLAGLTRGHTGESAAELARRVRGAGDFSRAIGTLIGHYEQAIARNHVLAADPDAEMRAIAAYLRKIAPGIMKANNQRTGFMRPVLVWKPTTFPTGINPQK